MPFPTTPVLDTFERANATSLGASWSAFFGDNNIGVTGSQAYFANAGADNGNYWNVATYGPGIEAYATITAGTSDEWKLYVFGASSAANPNGYAAGISRFGAASHGLVRYDAGTSTNLGAGISQAISTNDQIGVSYSATGGTLVMWRNGASLATRTDTTYKPNAVAIELVSPSAANVRLNNFGGGTMFETGAAVGGTFVGGADIISGPTYDAFQGNAFQADAFQTTATTVYNETGAGVAGTFAACADLRSLAESGAGVAGVVASGADRRSLSESGAAVAGTFAAGAERFSWVETAAGIAGVFAAGLETVTLSDSGYGLAGAEASGAEQFSGGAVTYNETGAGVAGAEAYVTDAAALVDSGYSIAGAAVFGADALTITETGAALVGGAAYGSDAATSSESGAGLLGAIAAGADVYAMIDSGYGLAGAVAAGADLMVLAGPAARAELVRQFGATVAEDDTAARAPAARVQQSGATARGKGSKVA